MAFQPKEWIDLIGALANPQQRHLNDQSTFEDLNWSRHNNKLPEGLSLQWLGTAGFRFDYQGYTLLADPYFTRPNLRNTLSRAYVEPEPATIEKYLNKADAILCGHTHFDHALDIPEIVKRYNCEVFGSNSLKSLMALYNMADKANEVVCNKAYELGPFEVTFIESLHSKLVLGLAVPAEGELCCEHLDHLNAGNYRCGQVYGIHIKVAGISFYHQGSANLIDESIIHQNVDYFLAGISGRSFTKDYTKRILHKLSPQVIIPHHFDNFFKDLNEPLTFSLNVNLGRFIEEVNEVSSEFEIRTLNMLQCI
jgi:L-ascorbate metabolism protein UlaG (beta-lactamase superfamily)